MSGVALHDVSQKLAAFIKGEMAGEKDHTLISLELIHAAEGCQPESLREWNREKADDAPYFVTIEYVDRLASDIFDLAEERAGVFSGVHNLFKLRAARSNGGRYTYAFRILPPIDQDMTVLPAQLGIGGSDGRSGDVNERGVLAMQMRNNTEIMRVNKEMMAGTIGVLTKTNADLTTQLRDAQAEIARLYSDQRADVIATRNHELEVVRQHNKEARKDALVGKAIQLLPVVASRFLTDGNGTNSTNALAALVAQLAQSLSPQQLAQLGSTLRMEQRAIFGELLRVAQLQTTQPEQTPAQHAGTNGTPVTSPSPASVPSVNANPQTSEMKQ